MCRLTFIILTLQVTTPAKAGKQCSVSNSCSLLLLRLLMDLSYILVYMGLWLMRYLLCYLLVCTPYTCKNKENLLF